MHAAAFSRNPRVSHLAVRTVPPGDGVQLPVLLPRRAGDQPVDGAHPDHDAGVGGAFEMNFMAPFGPGGMGLGRSPTGPACARGSYERAIRRNPEPGQPRSNRLASIQCPFVLCITAAVLVRGGYSRTITWLYSAWYKCHDGNVKSGTICLAAGAGGAGLPGMPLGTGAVRIDISEGGLPATLGRSLGDMLAAMAGAIPGAMAGAQAPPQPPQPPQQQQRQQPPQQGPRAAGGPGAGAGAPGAGAGAGGQGRETPLSLLMPMLTAVAGSIAAAVMQSLQQRLVQPDMVRGTQHRAHGVSHARVPGF